MAQRRMFSKQITNSSSFLMMPHSSQNLYFHLGMNADDDGFCEHFSLMRMTDSKPDDLKILQAKNFVRVFDDKVLIIVDWKENNYLRSDRYTASKYLEVYKKELKLLAKSGNTMATIGIPNGDTGKDRLGKDRLGEETSSNSQGIAEIIKTFIDFIDPKNKNYYGNKNQRSACEFLINEYGLDETIKAIKVLPLLRQKISYLPSITTPCELRDKWTKISDAVNREKLKDIKEKPIVIFG